MKDKLLLALQISNVILIMCMLGVQIAELVRVIVRGKSNPYIRIK